MILSHNLRKLALAAAALAGMLGFAGAASASTWQETHPRRVEVNHRLANQNARIDRAEASGRMSPGQAARLHRQDRRVRHEERLMASMNRGHITQAEKRALNQQENRISNKIQ